MAYKNKLIRNTKTGQDITFLQTAKDTGGLLLEMETTYHAASKEPPLHYHPYQEEYFRVREGTLTVRIKGQVQTLRTGDRFHIPKNTRHAMWNASAEKTVVNWQVRPALDTEYFLETATGIVAHGKTSAQGMPSVLQAALTANRYSNVFRLARPPFAIQKLAFFILTPFAYLLGYRPAYKKYLD